jgi:hypothetical protein
MARGGKQVLSTSPHCHYRCDCWGIWQGSLPWLLTISESDVAMSAANIT